MEQHRVRIAARHKGARNDNQERYAISPQLSVSVYYSMHFAPKIRRGGYHPPARSRAEKHSCGRVRAGMTARMRIMKLRIQSGVVYDIKTTCHREHSEAIRTPQTADNRNGRCEAAFSVYRGRRNASPTAPPMDESDNHARAAGCRPYGQTGRFSFIFQRISPQNFVGADTIRPIVPATSNVRSRSYEQA